MKLIDKDAVVAEIKGLIRANELYLSEPETDEIRFQKVGAYSVLNDLLHFLDTLEVRKENKLEGVYIPLLFKEGDIVYRKDNKTLKLFIIKIDKIKGVYICDGSFFKIIDEYNYKKVEFLSDLCVGECVRIKKDPNCYSISEFLDGNNIKLHQIHGDDYYITVNAKELCCTSGHLFNFNL